MSLVIYEFPDKDAPIRQGDIFMGLPRIDVCLDEMFRFCPDSRSSEATSWSDLHHQDVFVVVCAGRTVAAIVGSQDCDAATRDDITLFEIRKFRDVERRAEKTEKHGSWADIITQHARLNQKWFYLPPDERVRLYDKMAVTFLVPLRLRRLDLEAYKNLRTGRLNVLAEEHFRERVSEFYRRYAYNEWYALNRPELEAYRKKKPNCDAPAYLWQQENGAGGEAVS